MAQQKPSAQVDARPALAQLMERLNNLAQQSTDQDGPQRPRAMFDQRLAAEQATNQTGTTGETVSDDAPFSPAQTQQIKREEQLIRRVLGLFNLNYDALIDDAADSPYAQAIAAQPQILEIVRAAESPALAALEVAVMFQPYAEFTKSYGQDPAAIKDAIRAEVMAELNGAGDATIDTAKAAPASKFANSSRDSKPVVEVKRKRKSLAELLEQRNM